MNNKKPDTLGPGKRSDSTAMPICQPPGTQHCAPSKSDLAPKEFCLLRWSRGQTGRDPARKAGGRARATVRRAPPRLLRFLRQVPSLAGLGLLPWEVNGLCHLLSEVPSVCTPWGR